jgi:protein-S-isoprenylcysteine O-methyltransferase Ste14
MYASYMLIDVGLLFSFLSLRNVLVIIGAVVSYVLRARLEEHMLQRDAQYRAYMVRTRFRFVPGVY